MDLSRHKAAHDSATASYPATHAGITHATTGADSPVLEGSVTVACGSHPATPFQ
jgi:hypothetical protein